MTPPLQAPNLAHGKQRALNVVLSDGQRTEELAVCGKRIAGPANTKVGISRSIYNTSPLAGDGCITQRNQGSLKFDYQGIPMAEAAQSLVNVRQVDRGTMAGVVTASKRRITRVTATLSADTRERWMTRRSDRRAEKRSWHK